MQFQYSYAELKEIEGKMSCNPHTYPCCIWRYCTPAWMLLQSILSSADLSKVVPIISIKVIRLQADGSDPFKWHWPFRITLTAGRKSHHGLNMTSPVLLSNSSCYLMSADTGPTMCQDPSTCLPSINSLNIPVWHRPLLVSSFNESLDIKA